MYVLDIHENVDTKCTLFQIISNIIYWLQLMCFSMMLLMHMRIKRRAKTLIHMWKNLLKFSIKLEG